jgi:hypothetical protein
MTPAMTEFSKKKVYFDFGEFPLFPIATPAVNVRAGITSLKTSAIHGRSTSAPAKRHMPRSAMSSTDITSRLLKKCRSDFAAYQNPENPSRNGI